MLLQDDVDAKLRELIRDANTLAARAAALDAAIPEGHYYGVRARAALERASRMSAKALRSLRQARAFASLAWAVPDADLNVASDDAHRWAVKRPGEAG